MTFNKIINDINNKKYYPVYFLSGMEAFFIDEISDHIENNVLNESEKEFNQSILYGKDVNEDIIINNAKRYPMMSKYQVVIIKEAQNIKKFEKIKLYLENPLESTLLVFCYKYKKLDNRTKLATLIKKTGVLFDAKPLYDYKIPDWIENYVNKKSYRINPNAKMLLAETLGNDLGKIVNEVNKLFINLPKNSLIDEDIIEKNIGISKDFNVFELQKVIGKRDTAKAYQIAHYFAANPKEHPLILTIPAIFNYFIKILMYKQLKNKSTAAQELGVHPFFVGEYKLASQQYKATKVLEIITLLKEYDLKSKGVNSQSATDGELLKELVFKIFN